MRETPVPPASPRSAEELAVEAQGGSTSSFSELVERFHAPLVQFLFVRTGDRGEAEELCQETFLRAWTKLHLYDPERRFSTWLFTVARRLAVSRARSRGGALERSTDGLEELARDPDDDPTRAVRLREESRRVWDVARELLSREQRTALWLRYAEDLSIEEIAGILGRRRVTVRVILFRARERLARHLAPAEPEPRSATGAAGLPGRAGGLP